MPQGLRESTLPGEEVRKSGGAVDLEQLVNDGPAEVEIAQQHRAFGQVRLRQREVDGGKRLSLRGRGTGDDDGVKWLQGLQMIQPGAQGAEFLGRCLMRVAKIQKVRLGRGREGDRK